MTAVRRFISVVLSSIVLSILFSTSMSLTCPGSPCICDNGEVMCICGQNGVRENVTLNNMVKIGGYHSVTIEHCNVVEVEYGAFRLMPSIDSLTFHDIKKLVIHGDAFNAVSELHTVNISQIEEFIPMSHIFYKIGNITNFFLTGVKANTLPAGFLGASYCQMLILTDLEINSIDQHAFFFEVNGQLAISNATIDSIHSEAFTVRNKTNGVFLKNVTVDTIEIDALNFKEIFGHLIIQESTFKTTQPSFLKTNSVKYFSLQNCFVGYCETNSFESVVVKIGFVTGKLSFSNNRFEEAQENCFPPAFSNGQTRTELNGNHFICNCEFEWFYRNKYEQDYDTSTCTLDNLQETRVNETEVVLGPDGKCERVALISERENRRNHSKVVGGSPGKSAGSTNYELSLIARVLLIAMEVKLVFALRVLFY